MLLPSKYDPFKKVKPLNLAEQFAKFAAYSKQQQLAGAYDQPGYMGGEDNDSWFEREKVKEQIEREEI